MNWSRRHIPSFLELLAFESAARHRSVTRAAAELALTQSGVSRQIAKLEETIGAKLFERVRRSIVLTDAGALYLSDVRAMLDRLGEAGERVAGLGADKVLNLAVLPTFATRWLIPRLPNFMALNRGAQINLSVRLAPFAFESEPFHAAIHYGDNFWPSAELHELCGEDIIAVCKPEMFIALQLFDLKNLAQATLLHQTTRPYAWETWLEAQGVGHQSPRRGPRMEQFGMIFEAAMAGLGVALVPEFLARPEIAASKLAVLRSEPYRSEKRYWFVIPESARSNALTNSFRDWLVGEFSKV